MNGHIPRMRMFAGPNGSGKSTIIEAFRDTQGSTLLGTYINADEIEKQINEYGFLDFRAFDISTTQNEWHEFASASTLLSDAELLDTLNILTLENDMLLFYDLAPNSYYASSIASFIREKLLEEKKDFTFETVMSHRDKVDFLKKAQSNGFKTYLYYVATDDPDINVSRVKNRVKSGGHDVPEQKIRDRYIRSTALLKEALLFSDRAFIFDNSGSEHTWLAEYTQGAGIEFKVKEVPIWLMYAFLPHQF